MAGLESKILEGQDLCPIMEYYEHIGRRSPPRIFTVIRVTKAVLACPFRRQCMIRDTFPKSYCNNEIRVRMLEGKDINGREAVILAGME